MHLLSKSKVIYWALQNIFSHVLSTLKYETNLFTLVNTPRLIFRSPRSMKTINPGSVPALHIIEVFLFSHLRIIFRSGAEDNVAVGPDTFLTPFTSPYDDFTTLASADHLIMTQSSFAWWAAWLLEQRVLHTSNYTKHPDILYNKHPFINNTRLWRDYRRINLYPEHWIGYTNHSVDTQKEILCTSTNVTSCLRH